MSLFILIFGLVMFIGLVLIHEFGHFITARRNGVDVEEFGLFFPPRLYSRKTKGGWVFSINAIPLGGFVKLKGEHDSDTAKGSFGAASMWVKTKIMVAGVFNNLLVALVLFTLLAIIGIPSLIPDQYSVKSDTKVSNQKVLINNVEKGSPAANAGLKLQDQLIGFKPEGKSFIAVNNSNDLSKLTKSLNGQKVQIFYSRNGKNFSTNTTLLASSTVIASQKAYKNAVNSTNFNCANIKPPKGYLGVTSANLTLQRSTWSAPVTAVGLSTQITTLTFKGIGQAFSGLGSIISGLVTGNSLARNNGACTASVVNGPIGLFFILKAVSHWGLIFMIFIIAYISLVLAIMNILPIPALDGGRLWLMLGSRVVKKPLSASKEELINAIGFLVLIFLIILISISDVNRFF